MITVLYHASFAGVEEEVLCVCEPDAPEEPLFMLKKARWLTLHPLAWPMFVPVCEEEFGCELVVVLANDNEEVSGGSSR